MLMDPDDHEPFLRKRDRIKLKKKKKRKESSTRSKRRRDHRIRNPSFLTRLHALDRHFEKYLLVLAVIIIPGLWCVITLMIPYVLSSLLGYLIISISLSFFLSFFLSLSFSLSLSIYI